MKIFVFGNTFPMSFFEYWKYKTGFVNNKFLAIHVNNRKSLQFGTILNNYYRLVWWFWTIWDIFSDQNKDPYEIWVRHATNRMRQVAFNAPHSPVWTIFMRWLYFSFKPMWPEYSHPMILLLLSCANWNSKDYFFLRAGKMSLEISKIFR